MARALAGRLGWQHAAHLCGGGDLTEPAEIFDRAAVRRPRARAAAPVSLVAPLLEDAADEEMLPFGPASFDLVVANLSLHWVNDLPGALIQLRGAMKPEGLLLASLPLLGTLDETRRALTEAEAELRGGVSPRISPFADLRDCAGLLQRAGFTLPVADVEDIDLLYADPLALLRDLQAAGERNAIAERGHGVPPRGLFPAALMRLPMTGDGRIPVRLRLGIMTGWAPPATS